jgi:hypothetical protein
VKFLPYSPYHTPSLTALKNPSSTKILITLSSFHISHLHLGIFAIFYNNKLHISDYVLESSQKRCTTSALLHALRRTPTSNNVISIFYTDKQFPSYALHTHDSDTLDLSLALTTCFDDLLTNSELVFPGFWFLKSWVGAWASEWHQQCKEEATMKTIHTATPLPPSCDRMFLEWRHNWKAFSRSDPRQHYAIFFNDPSPSLHPFVKGVLSSKSRTLQCAAFQLATHHAFDATYSASFHPTANDNTSCPHCPSPWTITHVLFECDAFWEP